MLWTEQIALEIKKRNKPLEWVDDMKTPSGRIHVGALRGVLIHDEVFKQLQKLKVESKFTYIFDDLDPMDSLPSYLDKEKYEKYMGIPLKNIPAPEGVKNYAQFYALEFKEVFNSLGVDPEIIWQSELYSSGKLNKAIELALDNSEKILDIYQKVSGSQKREQGWLPFAPICENCGKIGTTKATGWDGKEVEYSCEESMVSWAKGCGFKGKVSPFDGHGKLPWKVEWPSKWFALGVTVEGEGKDHASKGGSRDVANHICQEILHFDPPFDLPYEFFLVGGAKMSSSKGVGVSALEASKMLPPEVLRFLLIRTRLNQAIDFDPSDKDFIFRLFDDFDREQPFFIPRFSLIINWVQMPNIDSLEEGKKLKGPSLTEEEKKKIEERVKYIKIWLEKYAPEDVKFSIQKDLPVEANNLTEKQKEFLAKVVKIVDQNQEAEEFQNNIYQIGKELGLSSSEAFKAIYLTLIGKDHGPKAAWLILSLDKKFIKERFTSL